MPPPAQFSVSLQILDKDGVRIRNKEVKAVTADEVVPVTAAAREKDTAEMLPRVVGNWKSPTGSCDSAFLKAGARAKTIRGEEALNGTITNAGLVINALVIINGPRVGQIVDRPDEQNIITYRIVCASARSAEADRKAGQTVHRLGGRRSRSL